MSDQRNNADDPIEQARKRVRTAPPGQKHARRRALVKTMAKVLERHNADQAQRARHGRAQ